MCACGRGAGTTSRRTDGRRDQYTLCVCVCDGGGGGGSVTRRGKKKHDRGNGGIAAVHGCYKHPALATSPTTVGRLMFGIPVCRRPCPTKYRAYNNNTHTIRGSCAAVGRGHIVAHNPTHHIIAPSDVVWCIIVFLSLSHTLYYTCSAL